MWRGLLSTPSRAALVFDRPPSTRVLARRADDEYKRRLAHEAYERIRAFMVDNDVYFDRAEPRLLWIEQAWSIDSLDEPTRMYNRNTIHGIATILKDYPMLRCTVHGETGRANVAPTTLADYLHLDPVTDVHQCMDALARMRAEACLEALVAEGVPREQLLISSLGMGGRIRVDFIPEGYFPEDGRGLVSQQYGKSELAAIERQVVKEVPVEVVRYIDREVIKHVPIEVIKYVDREVVKEVPVEIVRYIEKDAMPAPPLEKVRREAHQRLRAFMVDNTIHFNGAGEEDLPRVEQAWAIEHLDEGAKRHNRNTIRGIANILKDYPGLRCTVHGETGRANSVPLRLADHLRLHPTADLHQCMEVLARRRAEACLEALVVEGVPREQLLISSKGMGARHNMNMNMKHGMSSKGTGARRAPANTREHVPRARAHVQRLRVRAPAGLETDGEVSGVQAARPRSD